MAADLEQLDQDAVLMLYAVDELPAEQRSAVAARLAAGAELSGRVERLRSAGEACFAALGQSDAEDRVGAGQDAAVRRIGRAMRQWQVDRALKNTPAPVTTRRWRIPVWAYPAAAAVIVVGFVVWTARQPVTSITAPAPSFNEYVNAQDNDLADWMGQSLRDGTRADVAADNEYYAVSNAPATSATADAMVARDLDGIFLRDDSEQ